MNLADILIVNSIEFKKEMKKKFSVNFYTYLQSLNTKEILSLSKQRSEKIFPKNVLKIINVGRLVDQKDQLTLLMAINELKDLFKFKLILIGRGSDEKKLKEFIKLNKLSKLVTVFYSKRYSIYKTS